MRSLRVAAAAALLAGLVPASGAFGGPGEDLIACRSESAGHAQVTRGPERWVRIAAPKFDAGEGPSEIAAFTAAPHKPNTLYVTNGSVVKLSADAGCTWSTIYRGNSLGTPVSPYQADAFTHLVAPNDSTLWLASYDDVHGIPHPHVYVGSDIGVDGKSPTFSQLDVGLPSYGRPVSLLASSIAGREAYVLIDQLPDPATGEPTTATRHLYTTYVPDNPPELGAVTGTAWEEITPPTGFGRIDGVSRQGAHALWIWSGNRLAFGMQVSTAPVSWHVATAAGPILAVDVAAGGFATVVSQGPQGTTVQVANPQGALRPWGAVPVAPISFTHGEQQQVYAASGRGGTWGFDHRLQRWVDITPRGVAAFTHLEIAPATSTRVVLGLTPRAIYRWDTYYDETFIEPPPPPTGTGDPDNPVLPTSDLTSPLLTPVQQVVTVQPGAARDVPVTFRVPPAPTPLDVLFMVDTTASMGPAIRGLQKAVTSIATDLRARLGISACFGVAGVKDFSPDSSYVYQSFLPVSPCDAAPGLPRVRAAAAKLVEGGGGDPAEAQTVGLMQAIRGDGQSFVPVPAGQGAGFRPGAFKVIVFITDNTSHEGAGYPTIASAAQTLNVNDVKVVGIAVNDVNGDLAGAKGMMRQLAVATHSMSPPAGVDCNGDGGGYPGDLGPNEPLICEVSASGGFGSEKTVNIGPAIIGLLLAVKDPGTVAVDVTDRFNVVRRPIRGLTSLVGNLKYESDLHFTMSVQCTQTQNGRDLPVGLVPTIRSVPIGLYGEVLVRCRALPVPLLVVPPPPDEPFITPPQRPHISVAPAPPAPVNAPAQPISNINPNAGMAQEQEQQPQLAMVTQDVVEEDEELAMSSLGSRRQRNDTAPLALGAAALLTATAFAHQRRSQRQARLGYVSS